jgi:non-specific serine/threonine protein kinase/serine/threonine-protein kinase
VHRDRKKGETLVSDDALRDWDRLSPLMDEVLGLPGGERNAFVERACAGEPRLLERMRRWLSALESSADFLEHAHAPIPGVAAPFQALPQGQLIGAYRIERLLGHGGMGEVYLAARADGQFEQAVAIKLIDAAFADEPQQFLEERRILARLEHPGITRLFDGGISADGRPYMVMERVEGRDLPAWCREQRSPLEQRLRLFVQLCQAAGYAHRHLVVHRDIKPGNVLVTAEGQVKLLDFGIARLLDHPDAAEQARPVHATPAFAAPEQLTGGDITAATDVYALGVLLYHLLSGRAPVALNGLPTALAIERAVNEIPVPPSAAATPDAPVAARRLRGDLDAIVLKCLRKNPQQRYASALELEEDLQRHLRHQTVAARGDTPGYVLGRFVRRHRLTTAAAALLLAVVLGATAVVAGYAHTVRVQRDEARTQTARLEDAEDYLFRLFRHAGAEPGQAPVTVKQLLDRERARSTGGAADPESQRMRRVLGHLYGSMDDDASAIPVLTAYLADASPGTPPADLAAARADLAQVLLRSGGSRDEARRQFDQAQAFWSADPDRYSRELLESRTLQSQLMRAAGDSDGGIRVLREAVAESQRRYGDNDLHTAYSLNDLASALQQAGQMAEARASARHAWRILVALHHEHSEQALNVLNNLGAMAYYQGDLAEAEPRFREAVSLRRELFGPSAAMAVLLNNYGKLLIKQDRAAEALPLVREAAADAEQYSGPASFLTVACQLSLAQALVATDAGAEAETQVQKTLDIARTTFGDRHLLTAAAQLAQARLRFRQKRAAEGTRLLDTAQATAEALGPPGKGLLGEAQKLRQAYSAGSSSS